MKRSLRDTQLLLAHALRSPRPLAETDIGDALSSIIAEGARLSSVAQADIYREMFLTRHIDCLADDFPALLSLLGPETFERLAMAYLSAHPPASFSLADLGASLPLFVAQNTLAQVPTELAADLARFEWALVEAHDEAQLPALDPRALEGRTDEQFDAARVTLSPSLRVLVIHHDVSAIYEPLLEQSARIVPRREVVCVAVVRNDAGEVEWSCIDLLQGRALDLLQKRLTIADAFEQVAATLDQAQLEHMAASVGAWFSSWLARGWVREVQFP